MRRAAPILFSLSCVFALASCSKAPEITKAQPLGKAEGGDGVLTGSGDLPAIPAGAVAVVNGTEITSAAFHAIYDLKLQKYADRGREIPKTADRRYRKSIVDRLIWQEVLRQESAKRSLQHDEDALTQREEGQIRGIKDWEKHLRRRGESEESLRELYIAELRERAILEADGMLEVTDAEIQEEYEKVKPNYNKDKERIRAAHILIRVGPTERPPPGEPIPEPTDEQKKQWEEAALAKANEIYEKVSAEGADFGKLAIELSEGPSARKGGDLGIFAADRMVEEFSDAAFALEAGEASKPIKTKFGFHIIKVYGKYAPGDLPREALEDQIKERLAARKLHQGKRDLKEKLMASYTIVNEMEKALGPDPRAERRRKNRRRQGHPPGAKPKTQAGGTPPASAATGTAPPANGVAGGPPAGDPPTGAPPSPTAPDPNAPAPSEGGAKPIEPPK